MYNLIRPILFRLDAEHAHDLALQGMDLAHRTGFGTCLSGHAEQCPTSAFGLTFPNPVGLAAGLDKDGEHIDALGAMGFGFIEVGTVTPRPQPGNPRPRLFRLPKHQAIINRMGFNNKGVDALVRRVAKRSWKGILGINIGRNKDTPNERAIDDYLLCLQRVYALADYVTVNISSPNTTGLRDLQQGETLKAFIGTLREEQEKLAAKHGKRKPMLLKIAPDLDEPQLDAVADILVSAAVDGVICTNTTIRRDLIQGHPLAGQAGGLSGRVLLEPANAVQCAMQARLQGRVPIIGVGGITHGSEAADKIKAGASLVQLYTGFIYRGPELVSECVRAIARQHA